MKTDVLASELSLECLPFDRPAILGSEVSRVGLLAFSFSYGYGGLSLAAWIELRKCARQLAETGEEIPFFGLEEDSLVSLGAKRQR